MSQTLKSLPHLIGILILAAMPAFSQNLTATVNGTVTDSSGALIQGARVTVVNHDTRVVAWDGKSNSAGQYVAPQLPVGTYVVTAEQTGFKKMLIENVTLSVDQAAQVNLVLSPGDVAESVTIAADVATLALERADSSLSTLVNPSQLDDLPLPSRNPMNLLLLVTGVATGGTGDAGSGISTYSMSFNGSRVLATEVTMDGTSTVENGTGQPQTVPSPDALQEIKVMTSAYSAESGRTGGGTVAVVTKSGTNEYHGGLYELFRNEDMEGNNYFNNARNIKRGRDRFNNFGGSFGAPLRIPKLYDGRNKTFFFYNYDQTVTRSTNLPTLTVPVDAFKSGNFSASTIAVYDPKAGTPFPGNTIPGTRIDPASAKVMSFLPQPNTTGISDPQNSRFTNNYINPQTITSTFPKQTARLDHAVGSSVRIFGSVNDWASNNPTYLDFSNVLDTRAPGGSWGFQAQTGVTGIISPTLVTDIRFGVNRYYYLRQFPTLGTDVAQVLGIGTQLASLPPNMNITSWQAMGPATGSVKQQASNTYQLSGTTTKVFTRLVSKVGFSLRKNAFNGFSPSSYYMGNYTFDGSVTNKGAVGGNAIDSLGQFLLGSITSAQYQLPAPELGRRNYNIGAFIQNDWKVSSRLTVNAGLRWDFESPQTEAKNMYSRFSPVTGQLLVAGQNASSSLDLNASYKQFQPRVGFAYSLNRKTVVRSAFGLFFSGVMNTFGSSVTIPGYDVTQSYPQPGPGLAQAFTLSQGMPLTAVQNLQNPAAILKTATTSNPVNAGSSISQLSPNPSILQWNFGVQRELARRTILEVNYVGTAGRHLEMTLRSNQPAFSQGAAIAFVGTTAATQAARQFPLLTAIPAWSPAGNSNYHALQTKLNRQFSSTLGYFVAYTWSKAIDDGGIGGNQDFALPGQAANNDQFPDYFRNLDKAVSAFDTPQMLSVSVQYRTKGSKWVRGFMISPMLNVQSGKPVVVTQSNYYPGVLTQRPMVTGATGNVGLANWYNNGPAIQYFMPATDPNFPLSPSGPIYTGSGATRTMIVSDAIGNLGRNTERAPGATILNVSAVRTFPLREKVSLQLRLDAFNTFNHTNLNMPATALTVATSNGRAIFNSPGFGQITSARSPRVLQLVARFSF